MATTPYPFVASTVLTALQLNSTFNIPTTTKTASHTFIAADAGTRVIMNAAGSTSLTLNTSIFSASDVIELQNIGAGVATVTAGTATVSSAGPLAIPQHGGGRLVFSSASAATFFPSAVTIPPASSGLDFISSTNLSTASVTVSNCFSATYDNYLVVIYGATAVGTPTVKATIGAITTNYVAGKAIDNGAFSYTASQAFWDFGFCGDSNNPNVVSHLIIYNPFATSQKIAVGYHIYPANQYYELTGTNTNTTSCTSLTLTTSNSNVFDTGYVRIYGYQNS